MRRRRGVNMTIPYGWRVAPAPRGKRRFRVRARRQPQSLRRKTGRRRRSVRGPSTRRGGFDDVPMHEPPAGPNVAATAAGTRGHLTDGEEEISAAKAYPT